MGYLPKGTGDVFTHTTYFATLHDLVAGLDKGEQVVGVGGIAIGNFLHGCIPWHSDVRGVSHLRGIGECETVDVAFFDMCQVGKANASAIDAKEEDVASKSLWL